MRSSSLFLPVLGLRRLKSKAKARSSCGSSERVSSVECQLPNRRHEYQNRRLLYSGDLGLGSDISIKAFPIERKQAVVAIGQAWSCDVYVIIFLEIFTRIEAILLETALHHAGCLVLRVPFCYGKPISNAGYANPPLT